MLETGWDSGNPEIVKRGAREMEHDADNERHTAAMPKRTLAQFVGCLLGGAVGDALGAPLDALSLVEIRALCGSNGALTYRPVFDRSGSITSCTQLTLFTAEGFLRADNRYRDRGICNPYLVIARAYLRWLEAVRLLLKTYEKHVKQRAKALLRNILVAVTR